MKNVNHVQLGARTAKTDLDFDLDGRFCVGRRRSHKVNRAVVIHQRRLDRPMAAKNPEDVPTNLDLLRCMQEMTRYLPALEDPDFLPGEIRSGQKTESGSIIMPYVMLGDVAEALVATAYDRGWVLGGFHWVSWGRSEDALALCSDPCALARAEPMQLLYLITALIRQDRFSEGTLLGAFKSRLILGVVRRAAAIVEAEKRQSQG